MKARDLHRFFEELDRQLNCPIEVILTGGAAAILQGVERAIESGAISRLDDLDRDAARGPELARTGHGRVAQRARAAYQHADTFRVWYNLEQNLQLFPDAGPAWHPGRSGTLRLGPKTILAAFGEIHPRLANELDAPERAVAAEIYLDAIPAPRSSGHARAHYTPPALQPVTRDFAFIVPTDLPAENLVRAIRSSDKQWITEARLFDRFETPEGLSLAVEVTLQPSEKSFTDVELAEISKRVVAAAEKLGARLRS